MSPTGPSPNFRTVLFDIDGTLADIRHRVKHLKSSPPNWTAFNQAMGEDVPNETIVSLYKILWATGEYNLILVTGRNEKFRILTEQWLTWNDIPFGELHMRADNDQRADHVIKEEILRKLISQGVEIQFVVDDRQQVVDMWRRNGITCLQADVGNF